MLYVNRVDRRESTRARRRDEANCLKRSGKTNAKQPISSPPGSPSHTSSQSYLHSPSLPGRGSFSRSKVRKLRVTSMLGGTMMMKLHSRLWGYLSGNPGDSMRPVGLVKFWEQSEPAGEDTQRRFIYGQRGTDHTPDVGPVLTGKRVLSNVEDQKYRRLDTERIPKPNDSWHVYSVYCLY